MKKIFLLVLILISCLRNEGINAQTVITDNISSNSTWTIPNSPYIIDSYIGIEAGVTLTIQEGVVVKFKEFTSIDVQGSLVAEGTDQEQIIFTSYSDDEYGGDTNGDGDASEPYPGEWLSISLPSNSGTSIFGHCIFRYGGSVLEIGALDVYNHSANISNVEFNNCSLGLNVSTSAPISLSDLNFRDNESGLINTSQSTVSVKNSSFVNNSGGGVVNFSPLEMDATFNYWGIEDYLLGNDNDTSNLESIIDEIDNSFYGKVLYFPMLSPPLTIESITPNKSTLASGGATVSILGFLFDSESMLFLEKGEQIILPETIVSLDSFSIEATFSWDSAETGLYDVVVINPDENDTLRLESSFSLLDIDLIPFGEWVEFDVSSGNSYASAVSIPDSIENLFVLVKKSSRIDYSSTWDGLLRINSENGYYEINDRFFSIGYDVGTDMNYQISEPDSGLYIFEMETISEQGSGQIIFTDIIPQLVLGQWSSGEILRPYGHDWKVVEVPDGQTDLFIKTEGFGLWSTIEVYYENLIGFSEQLFFYRFGSGYQISGHIENPPPGKYYIRYTDSAVLVSGSNTPYTEENQYREYLIKVSTENDGFDNPLALKITGLSEQSVGKGITTLDIYGHGFFSTDSIHLTNGSEIISPVQKLYLDSLSTWSATFDLTDVSTGNWDLEIISENNVIESAPEPLAIIDSQKEEVTINVITSNIIRAGRTVPFIVELTNPSNIDAHFVPINISLSGAPTVYYDNIQPSSEIWEDIDWSVFEGEWNSWDDVPISFVTEDSITNEEFTQIPLVFPYIKAGQTLTFELRISYGSTNPNFSYEVTSMNSMAIPDKDDFLRSAGNHDCFYLVLETGADFFVDVVTPDFTQCSHPILSAYGSTLVQMSLSNFSQKPITMTGVATAGFEAVASCIIEIGSVTPAGKVLKGVKKILDILQGVQLFQEVYEECLAPNPPINGDGEIVNSTTPEDKYGIVGAEQVENLPMNERRNFINSTDEFEYRIDYWNKEDATAPASEVFIRDTLDENLDLTTFNFTEIGFLRWKVPLEGGHYFNVAVDMRPDENYIVNVEGTLNPFTREVYWVHRTFDAETLELPNDPFSGYLPPIDVEGYNLGWVNFSVQPEEGLPSGSIFQNQAHVNFDGVGPWGPAPPYGPYTNTYDFDAPESNVLTLDLEYSDTTFLVSWTGNDGDGAGIAFYNVYVSEDNAPYELWQFRTKEESAAFIGQPGKSYRFYSLATDKVGNIEDAPSEADASTSVLTNTENSFPDNSYQLYQNKPNPLSNSTVISFDIPHSSQVVLEVLNESKLIEILIDERLNAGKHEIEWKPNSKASGIYYYRLKVEKYTRTKKMILMN